MADLMNFDQFRNWASSQGSIAKYNDGGYLGECVSLINQYCWRVLNVPADAWGHAKDWGANPIQRQYFDVLPPGTPQRGDILVYGADFGNGLGHIEIATDGAHALYQNRNFDGRVGTGLILQGYYVILRRKEDMIELIPDRAHLDLIFQRFFLRNSLPAEQEEWIGKKGFTELLDKMITQPAYFLAVKKQEIGEVAFNDNWQGRLERLQAVDNSNKELRELLKEILETLKK